MRELSLKAKIAHKENIEELLKFMKKNGMVIDNIRITGENLTYEVDIRFSTLLKNNTYTVFNTFHALPYIQKIEIEILS